MKEATSSRTTLARISRRGFVQALTAATLGLPRGAYATASANGQADIKKDLSATVQMQFMQPGQLEKVMRDFPVVYVPFGLIEWHGRHLPLGNDAIKAHGILVKAAEQLGGVVYPPENQRSFKLPSISPEYWWMI